MRQEVFRSADISCFIYFKILNPQSPLHTDCVQSTSVSAVVIILHKRRKNETFLKQAKYGTPVLRYPLALKILLRQIKVHFRKRVTSVK